MAGKSKRHATANLPSQRQLRVGETVSITISEISISPDLSNARVYTIPLGGENSDIVLPALNRLAPVIQREVAARVHLRRVPRLKFLLDDSFDNAARLNVVFNSIRKDD